MATSQEKKWLGFFFFLLIAGLGMMAGTFYWQSTVVKPAQGGKLTAGLIGSPRFLNPILNQTNNIDQDISAIIFSSLMKYDGQGNLINDLAESYQIGDNGKIYEIILKKNVKWHDGQSLTAEDIIFTLKIIQDPEFESPLRLTWQGVEIEKIDNYAVRFKLKNAYAPFLHNLTFGILPKHLWENITPSSFPLNEMNLKPVGSGPYQFSKLQKDKNGVIKDLELKAFNNYFEGKPYIKQIVFYFFPSEEAALGSYAKLNIDSLSSLTPKNVLDLQAKNKDLTVFPLTLPRYFAIFFNQSQNKLLADINIRQALAFGLNKKEIIDKVFEGQAQEVNSPILAGMPGWSDSLKSYEFNPAEAQNILERIGWTDQNGDGFREKNNQTLELTLTVIDWPDLTKTAEFIQTQWNQIGMKINLDIKEMSKIQNEVIRPRQYQTLLFGEILSLEPDPFSFWHSSQVKDPGLNLSLYENRDADKLLEEARQNLDKNSRAEKYKKLAEIINNDLPAIFLFSPDYLFTVKKDFEGINLAHLNIPASRFSQINQWYIKTQRAWK